jgi:hypothetical protein
MGKPAPITMPPGVAESQVPQPPPQPAESAVQVAEQPDQASAATTTQQPAAPTPPTDESIKAAGNTTAFSPAGADSAAQSMVRMLDSLMTAEQHRIDLFITAPGGGVMTALKQWLDEEGLKYEVHGMDTDTIKFVMQEGFTYHLTLDPKANGITIVHKTPEKAQQPDQAAPSDQVQQTPTEQQDPMYSLKTVGDILQLINAMEHSSKELVKKHAVKLHGPRRRGHMTESGLEVLDPTTPLTRFESEALPDKAVGYHFKAPKLGGRMGYITLRQALAQNKELFVRATAPGGYEWYLDVERNEATLPETAMAHVAVGRFEGELVVQYWNPGMPLRTFTGRALYPNTAVKLDHAVV